MDGIVVKRYYGGGNGGDDRCRLTVLSPVDLSPKVACVNLSLPSYIDDEYIRCGGGGCGLLSFDEFEGNIVLCNLATRQLKRLPPPPKSKPRFHIYATGLGLDSKSDDFKVIRFLQQPYYEWGSFRGYNKRWELYSLKSGVWKDIPTPDDVFVDSGCCGVYVGGRCYWRASLGFSYGGSSIHFGFDILSFDFTTESFHCLHSPPHSSNTGFDLVEYRGSLGAIGFSRSFDPTPTGGFGFEFWVREESSWAKVFDVVLSNVERLPLGLIDGRFLFLERKCRSNAFLYQLVVYDRITKEWKEFDIYDYSEKMMVTFYVEGQVALPDAMPMQRYEEDDDDSGDSCMSTDEDEDEDEDEENKDGDSCMSTDEDEDEENEDGDSCMSTDEDEDEDEGEENEEEKQINMRRRERCDDWYDDDVDDSSEDEEDDDDSEHSCMSIDDDDDNEEENDDDDDDDYDEDEDKEADDR